MLFQTRAISAGKAANLSVLKASKHSTQLTDESFFIKNQEQADFRLWRPLFRFAAGFRCSKLNAAVSGRER